MSPCRYKWQGKTSRDPRTVQSGFRGLVEIFLLIMVVMAWLSYHILGVGVLLLFQSVLYMKVRILNRSGWMIRSLFSICLLHEVSMVDIFVDLSRVYVPVLTRRDKTRWDPDRVETDSYVNSERQRQRDREVYGNINIVIDWSRHKFRESIY